MKKLLTKMLSIRNMLKVHQASGELPPSKEVYKRSCDMAWPSAIEAVLVSLIGSIDTMMVGGLGAGAIAAVGITNQPKFILLAMIFSLNVGVTAIVARRKGQNDHKGANDCLRQALVISLVMSFVMGAIGFAFARPILDFAGASVEYLDTAVTYFRIIMVSIVFTAVSLTINAAQRGAGNTKISMRTNIGANIFNLVFNYLLIHGIWIFPEMGVAGAAVASVIGAIVGCIMSINSLFKPGNFLAFDFKGGVRFDKRTLSAILSISGSAIVEQLCIRVGFFAYAKIVATLGTVAFATHQICMNVINISFAFGDGLAIASSSLVGQSLGEKRTDMAIIYGKVGQRLAFIVSTVLFFVFIFGRRLLVSLFSSDPEVIALGMVIMVVIAFSTHLQTSQVVLSGCLRGAGDTKFVALSAFVCIGILRPIVTYLLCITFGFGLIGAWIALFVDQGVRFVLSISRFSKGKWTKIEI